MALPSIEPTIEKTSLSIERTPSTGCHDPHKEAWFPRREVIRDTIIGFADGLTVPFAVTAGLSSLGSSRLVVVGGLAELFSGSISMGLGAYLAAVTERDHYFSEEKRERAKLTMRPTVEKDVCCDLLETYDISKEASDLVMQNLCRDYENWVHFMMDFVLKLEKPNVSRAWISAGTMGAAYFIGGLIPMIPYFAVHNTAHALFISSAITVVILLGFGYIKNWITVGTKRSAVYGALQTLFVGVSAAGASYGIVKAIECSGFGEGDTGS